MGGADLTNTTSGKMIYTASSSVQILETENQLSLRKVEVITSMGAMVLGGAGKHKAASGGQARFWVVVTQVFDSCLTECTFMSHAL